MTLVLVAGGKQLRVTRNTAQQQVQKQCGKTLSSDHHISVIGNQSVRFLPTLGHSGV